MKLEKFKTSMIFESINNLDYVEEEDRFSSQGEGNLLLIMPILFKHIKTYLKNLI